MATGIDGVDFCLLYQTTEIRLNMDDVYHMLWPFQSPDLNPVEHPREVKSIESVRPRLQNKPI